MRNLFKKKNATNNNSVCHGLKPCLAGRDIILKNASHLVNEIKNIVSTPHELFEEIYLNTIYRFGERCQDMPWNKEGAPYDLISQQLNLCISTLKIKQSLLLPPNAGTEEIALEEPKWTFAFFLASLLFQLPYIQEDRKLLIFNKEGNCDGSRPIMLGYMHEPNLYYRTEWEKCEVTLCSTKFICFFLNQVIEPNTINWLYQSPALFDKLMDVLTAISGGENIIIETIHKAAEFNKYQIRKSLVINSDKIIKDESPSSVIDNTNVRPSKNAANTPDSSTLNILLNYKGMNSTANNEPSICRIKAGLFINIESLKSIMDEYQQWESVEELIAEITSYLVSVDGDYRLQYRHTALEDRRIFNAIVIKKDALNENWKGATINQDICPNKSL